MRRKITRTNQRTQRIEGHPSSQRWQQIDARKLQTHHTKTYDPQHPRPMAATKTHLALRK